MTKIKHNSLEIFILFTVILISSITVLLLILDTSKPSYYNGLWVLPLIFGVYFCIIWLLLPKVTYKVSTLVVLGVYGARMLFVPLVMYFGEYSTYGLTSIFSHYMGQALILMAWEFQIVAIYIILIIWKKNKNDILDYPNYLYTNNSFIDIIPKKIQLLILGVIIYILLILIGTPGLLKESFFLTTGRSEESYNLTFSGAVDHSAFGLSFGSQLVTIAFTLFWIIQVLLPPYLLSIGLKRINSSIGKNIFFLLTLLLTLLVSTEGRAHSIECALALLITANYSLKGKVKIDPKLIIIVIVGVTIYGLMDKSGVTTSNDTVLKEFSTMITAYLGGPHNVATAIAAARDNNSIGFLSIIPDLLQRLPYLTKIFTPIFGGTTNVIFNEYFGSRYLGQIIPSIGLGYTYFHFILAPIVPLAAVILAFYFEKRAQKSPDMVRKNLYYLGVIMMARASAMSNMLSGITYLGNFFFAWIIVYIGFIQNDIYRKKR
ncbi:hypothetical protein [Aerococcus urinaeequi]|uniref:hypothetical protein n=1 Tax=Aerococcus urinaeequi TaxID=51665 RepID=UPI003D6AFBB4